MTSKKLALFDFDGTITHADSLKEFIIYVKGKRSYYLGLLRLSVVMILYKVGWIPNWRAKEILLAYFFGGMPTVDFEHYCRAFADEQLPRIVRQKALERISHYQNEGVRVVVVSASPENWIGKWAEANDLEWIATKLEVKAHRITGRIAGKNCHGGEKVKRIQGTLDLEDYVEIHTFGDSKGDLPMLQLGTSSFYRPFCD